MPRLLFQAFSTLLTASAIACGILPQAVSAESPPVNRPARQPPQQFIFVAAGDLLGPYQSDLRLDDPSFAKVVRIVREADAAFANEEGSTFDFATLKAGVHAAEPIALPPHSLATTRAFKEMGFNLFSRANNHSTDWGLEGMLATDRALDAIGIVHAGTGRSLEAARAPAYFQSTKGRVALIASASFFPDDSSAGDPGHGSIWPPDVPDRGSGPRPGLNPLRVRKVTLVTPQEMSALCQISLRSNKWSGVDSPCPIQIGAELSFSGVSGNLEALSFRVSDKPGVTYDVNAKDRSEIIGSIAMARRASDFVVYSIHAHEGRSGEGEGDEPADFLAPLFHDIVDAGADVVVRSGPHFLQGVEIYHGKPIFYGLGNFFHDFAQSFVVSSEDWTPAYTDTVSRSAEWYESAIATSEFDHGVLIKVTIYPLLVEHRESPFLRGYPKLAQGADAHRILARIQQKSALFGTKLYIVNGVGIIKGAAGS